MAALTLANILARVKRLVPTTTMDTELGDAILERIQYLQSLDVFPFTEKYQDTTLAVGDWRVATPDNFAILKDLTVWYSGSERSLEILDPSTFSQMFPKPDEEEQDTPAYCCVNVAEGEIWFNCPVDAAYVIRIVFNAVPDDATDTTVAYLTELAKLTIRDWAAADGFRMLSEHDRAEQLEMQGNNKLAAMKKRYQHSLEEDARFISPKEFHLLRE
jgi:hypothetical protein